MMGDSEEFEFSISLSSSSDQLCPADEHFYRGQLLPLRLSRRLSMARTLLLSSIAGGGSKVGSFSSEDPKESPFLADHFKGPAFAAKALKRAKAAWGKLLSSLWRSFICGNQRGDSRMKGTDSCPPSPAQSVFLCSDFSPAIMSPSSSMEELQIAIQAAISYCKSTLAKQESTAAPLIL